MERLIVVSYLQIFVQEISLTNTIFWSHVLLQLFVSKNWNKAWIEMMASEGVEGVLAERKKAPSTCIIVNNA